MAQEDEESDTELGATGLSSNGAAVLGLLAIESWPRPWTTYELAKQFRRSLRWFWPRAERLVYDTPRRLVARGYASKTQQATGRRSSTVYSITPAGREALAAWMAEDGSAPQFELEQLLRVFFADQGSPEQLRATIARMAEQSAEALGELGAVVRATEGLPGQERSSVNALSLKLVLDLHNTTAAWARWAQEAVDAWEDPETRRDGVAAVFADAGRAGENPGGESGEDFAEDQADEVPADEPPAPQR